MRMRKKKNLIPRMERCAAVQVADGFACRGRWRELMPGARALHVELGCGKGRFTAETAKGFPPRSAMTACTSSSVPRAAFFPPRP